MNTHLIKKLSNELIIKARSAPIVIGLHAPKGTGKDTTAWGIVAAAHRHNVPIPHILKFADPLYDAVSILTGKSVEWLQDQRNKNTPFESGSDVPSTLWGKAPRWLLEQFGTEFVRDKLGMDYWVELAELKVAKTKPTWCIFTDVRFVNEALACDAVIELRRGNIEYGTEKDHISTRRLPIEDITQTVYLKAQTEEFYDELLESFLEIAVYGRSDPL